MFLNSFLLTICIDRLYYAVLVWDIANAIFEYWSILQHVNVLFFSKFKKTKMALFRNKTKLHNNGINLRT